MLGLKNLTMDKLTTAFMVISAAMAIFALSGAAGGSASTTMLFIWIVVALVLIGVWVAVAVEVFKRFFGSGGRDEERAQEQRRQARN